MNVKFVFLTSPNLSLGLAPETTTWASVSALNISNFHIYYVSCICVCVFPSALVSVTNCAGYTAIQWQTVGLTVARYHNCISPSPLYLHGSPEVLLLECFLQNRCKSVQKGNKLQIVRNREGSCAVFVSHLSIRNKIFCILAPVSHSCPSSCLFR